MKEMNNMTKYDKCFIYVEKIQELDRKVFMDFLNC